jgi:glycosyltransferase involved in cell wall biosynthesis
MKIVFLLPQEGSRPAGGFKVVYEYANRLARRNHEVQVLHIASLFPRNAHLSLRDRMRVFRYIPFALRGNWRPDRWFKLDPAVKVSWVPSLSPLFLPWADAYVATWWTTADHLGALRDLPGRKLYLLQHLETWLGSAEQVMATWKAPLEKIVIAHWLEDIAHEMGESCHYIPNGLDFTKFGRDVFPEDRNPKRVAMLFSHSLAWKGSFDGLAALAILKDKYPDLEAEFFGINERPQDLPAWIVYHHAPAQAELRRIYNRASIFLAPSLSEGWGLPPCEAMMCGAAVIATDIGGHREFCTDGENALLVPAENPRAIADAVVRLLEDPELRLRLARNGHSNIQRFTWDAACNAFESVLLIPPAVSATPPQLKRAASSLEKTRSVPTNWRDGPPRR